MTKDEFLSMLNEELENLDQEYKTTRQKVEYLEQRIQMVKSYEKQNINYKC